ncbi:MFS transporter [Pseudomonas tructae]|uniref:MFS transporter n=1 Tax=Pseudomonas tructae TaxID=2518644 RepID=A0A411MQB3_9PSED|nr:MFS transporter [Pseudomonas tructae]QBF28989.1 MFS transporter [Pseudomonas tructae]
MPAHSSAARIALFLCGCAAFLPLYATQGILAELARSLAVDARQVSWSITSTTLAVALIAPFVGVLTRHLRPKRVLVVASLLLSVPGLMLACAQDLDSLLLWRFVQGMLIPVIFATSVAYIGERWQGAQVTEVTSLYVAGTILGGFAGRFVTGLVTQYLGWREAFVLLAMLTVLLGLCIHWLLPGAARRVVDVVSNTRLSTLGNPQLLAACLVGFCVLFAQIATFTYVGLHLLAAPFKLSVAALGSVYAVFLLALVVTPIAGRLTGARPPAHLVVIAGILGLLGSLLTLLASLWWIILGLALSSTGVFLAQAAANAFITTTARHNKAGAVGCYLTFYYLGGSVGALLPALLWERWGWPGCVPLIMGAQLLVMVIAWFGWRCRDAAATAQLH